MANIVLISYAGYPYTPSSLCPDNGLGILAAVLREAGHDVRVLDLGTLDTMRRLYPEELSEQVGPLLVELGSGATHSPALMRALGEADAALARHQAVEVSAIADEVSREVRDLEPALVGLKLWNGDGFSGSVAIAEALRRDHQRLTIVAGGPHATWFGPRIYRHTPVFDAVILGEGEDKIIPLVEYARRRRTLDGIGGIVRSAQDVATPTADVVLDDVPPACYDEAVYPAMAGEQKLKLFVIDDSRGCHFNCAFCTHPFESGHRLRMRSARRIVDDMAQITRQQGVRAFRFAGSSTPGSLMAEVAEEIARRNLRVQYTSFAHFASSRPQHFELMHSSGLQALFFGLETGSADLMRKSAGKASKLHEVRETVLAAKAAGIAVVCSMIVPMPFESAETLQESVDLILDIRPDSVPVQIPGLLPNTAWLENAEAYGFGVDVGSYLDGNIDYKFKLMFPPTLWKPLPYTLRDAAGEAMDFAQMVATAGKLIATLESEGILTGVPDDNVLMAELIGVSPRTFRDQARYLCAAGDVEAMAQLVQAFNRAAAVGPS